MTAAPAPQPAPAPDTAMCECSHHWGAHAASGQTANTAACHGYTGSATPGPLRESCRCTGFRPWAGPWDSRTGEPVKPLMVTTPAAPAPEEVPVRLVRLWLCDPCLDGAGGECHTPGCAMWINRAPPGGYVCSACGIPVESEPCPDHGAPAPEAATRVMHLMGIDPGSVMCGAPSPGHMTRVIEDATCQPCREVLRAALAAKSDIAYATEEAPGAAMPVVTAGAPVDPGSPVGGLVAHVVAAPEAATPDPVAATVSALIGLAHDRYATARLARGQRSYERMYQLDGEAIGLAEAAREVRERLAPAWDALAAERDGLAGDCAQYAAQLGTAYADRDALVAQLAAVRAIHQQHVSAATTPGRSRTTALGGAPDAG